MTVAATNFEFVKQLREANDFTYKQLSSLSEYSEDYVRAWFSNPESPKFRPVPDRAVTILKLKMTNRGEMV